MPSVVEVPNLEDIDGLWRPRIGCNSGLVWKRRVRVLNGQRTNCIKVLLATSGSYGASDYRARLSVRDAVGLGRLVAPGTENSNVVVARIGSTARADVSSLTVDFDGDGLINFEIAPGIVDVTAEAPERGGSALDGLVGQHVSMATNTANRVLDSVINVEGVVAATTFEINNGTVVLGGVRPTAVAGLVDNGPAPNRPEPGVPSHDPNGDQGHGPDKPTGGHGDPADNGTRPTDDVVICLSHGCYGGELSAPKPDDRPGANNGTAPDSEPALDGLFHFTSLRAPPTPESGTESAPGDLVDVSILLPLRDREPEGDQFSNYGNEEIW